jgi:U1 small nuclear ribonucleoprotein C
MLWSTTNVRVAYKEGRLYGAKVDVIFLRLEIGHEKAQSVIDSITSSYADVGQVNPMLQPPAGATGFPPPFPGGLPGTSTLTLSHNALSTH